jgi:hypothetical protein
MNSFDFASLEFWPRGLLVRQVLFFGETTSPDFPRLSLLLNAAFKTSLAMDDTILSRFNDKTECYMKKFSYYFMEKP